MCKDTISVRGASSLYLSTFLSSIILIFFSFFSNKLKNQSIQNDYIIPPTSHVHCQQIKAAYTTIQQIIAKYQDGILWWPKIILVWVQTMQTKKNSKCGNDDGWWKTLCRNKIWFHLGFIKTAINTVKVSLFFKRHESELPYTPSQWLRLHELYL